MQHLNPPQANRHSIRKQTRQLKQPRRQPTTQQEKQAQNPTPAPRSVKQD